MRPANEKRRYIVTSFPIGWAHVHKMIPDFMWKLPPRFRKSARVRVRSTRSLVSGRQRGPAIPEGEVIALHVVKGSTEALSVLPVVTRRVKVDVQPVSLTYGHLYERARREVDLQQQLDDVIKWKHFPRYWPFVRGIHRWPVNSPHKGQWRGALMFSLICAWTNSWANNGHASDLRRHRAHYEVISMKTILNNFMSINCEFHKVMKYTANWESSWCQLCPQLVAPEVVVLWQPTLSPVTTKWVSWQFNSRFSKYCLDCFHKRCLFNTCFQSVEPAKWIQDIFSTNIVVRNMWWVLFILCCTEIKNTAILTKFSTLGTTEVAKMRTSGATSDENFVKMTTFVFRTVSLP